MRPTFRESLPVGVLLALFAALALSTARQKSATFDETHYLGVGSHLLSGGGWDLPSALLHPPLPFYLTSLGLIGADLDRSCFEPGDPADVVAGVRRGQCLMQRSAPSGDGLLLRARLPIIVLGVLLGFLVYRWSALLHGPGGGLVSLALFSLSPNLLAHATLLSPDIILAAFASLALFCLWRHRDAPAPPALRCGAALGLALASKYAALLLVPLVLALLGAQAVRRHRREAAARKAAALRASALSGAALLITAGFVVAALYGFRPGLYLQGIRDQVRIVGDGFPAFLGGEVSSAGGWWYYYLAAFALKVPLPVMAVLALSFVAGRGGSGREGRRGAYLLFPATAIFLAVSAYTKVNIGLRYVLPVFPLLLVLAGGAVRLGGGRTLRATILGGLLAWNAAECLAIHPDHLAYFNQAAGGAANGYRSLVDSNLDWGQDLKGLKAYLDERGVETVKLSYFGTADPAQYGLRYEALPSFLLPPSAPRADAGGGGLFAVSATNLYPLYVDLGPLGERLRQTRPVDAIGHSILIYRLEPDPGLPPPREPAGLPLRRGAVRPERNGPPSRGRPVTDG